MCSSRYDRAYDSRLERFSYRGQYDSRLDRFSYRGQYDSQFNRQSRFNDDDDSRGPFFESLRVFKNRSRLFHEYKAESEDKHNPRIFDRHSGRNHIRRLVAHACQFLNNKSYSSDANDHLALDRKESEIVDKIVNQICTASRSASNIIFEPIYHTIYVYETKEVTALPLFRVYVRNLETEVYVSFNGSTYHSVFSYLEDDFLSDSLVCFPRLGSKSVYEIDPQINKYPLEFYCVKKKTTFIVTDRLQVFLKAAAVACQLHPLASLLHCCFMFGYDCGSLVVDYFREKSLGKIDTTCTMNTAYKLFKSALNIFLCCASENIGVLCTRFLAYAGASVSSGFIAKLILALGEQCIHHIPMGFEYKSILETINASVTRSGADLLDCFRQAYVDGSRLCKALGNVLVDISNICSNSALATVDIIFKAIKMFIVRILDCMRTKNNLISNRMNSSIERALIMGEDISLDEFKMICPATDDKFRINEDFLEEAKLVLSKEQADKSKRIGPRLVPVKYQNSETLFITEDSTLELMEDFLLASGEKSTVHIRNHFYEVITTNGTKLKLLADADTKSGLNFVYVKGTLPECLYSY